MVLILLSQKKDFVTALSTLTFYDQYNFYLYILIVPPNCLWRLSEPLKGDKWGFHAKM